MAVTTGASGRHASPVPQAHAAVMRKQMKLYDQPRNRSMGSSSTRRFSVKIEGSNEDFVLRSNGVFRAGKLEVLEGRLYLAISGAARAPDEKWIHMNKKYAYVPFCADFGPMNIAAVHHYCKLFRDYLVNQSMAGKKIVFAVPDYPGDITNAVFMLGSFLCLHLNTRSDIVMQVFSEINNKHLRPYRDATWLKSTYDLSVKDCWDGLLRARKCGFYNFLLFDEEEYLYYDNPRNGDLHFIVPNKFIAFKGPVSNNRCNSFAHAPADFVELFGSLKVETIVRLNEAEYEAKTFSEAGFKHVDLMFKDCTVPSDKIVHRFLLECEEAQNVVAVHCLAGLGRTGTLIALYLMKHFLFTAKEAISWLRVCRPGSVIGVQQHFLHEQEQRMHRLGMAQVSGLGVAMVECSSSEFELSTCEQIAQMVTDGMMHRDQARSSSTLEKCSSDPHLRNLVELDSEEEAGAETREVLLESTRPSFLKRSKSLTSEGLAMLNDENQWPRH
eukprot:767602-Hanusia_phi.AAC.1